MSKTGWSRELLPRHVKPQPDELLSSWLTRLSLAHGLQLSTFCRLMWPGKIWSGDIDRRTTPEMLALLAQKTATSPRQAWGTTLRAYEGTLWEAGCSSSSRHWLLLGAIPGQRRHRPGLQYCPQCLRADAMPYFRRSWQLGFVTVCSDHHCALLDRCPACFDPVNFHLLPYDTDAMTRCYQCQLDLVVLESPALDTSQGHERLVTFQIRLLQALEGGWFPLAENQMVRLSDYLRVVRHLGRLLVTHHDADRQRARFCRRLDQPDFVPRWPASKQWALDGLSAADRLRLFLVLAWWLEDWPERFITTCLAHELWPRDLLGYLSSPPPWYEHTAQRVSWGEANRRAIQAYNDAQNAS